MPFTKHPAPATTVSAADLAAHFKDFVSLENRYVSGFGRTFAGNTITVQHGVCYVKGYKIGKSTDSDQSKALASNGTHYVYIDENGDLQSNTTGFPAQGTTAHVPLYEATVAGGVITGTTDKRSTVVDIQAKLKADTLESDGEVIATTNLKGKEVHLLDAGGTLRRIIKLTGGNKVAFYDTDGTTLKNSDIVSEVDVTSTDATKDKAVSNALAKGWEDHKNAASPHSGHEVTSNKDANSGYAGLDSNGLVNKPVKKVATGAPSGAAGDIGVNGGELKFGDGAEIRTAETTNRKGAASGYCDLDTSSLVPLARLSAASASARGTMSSAHFSLVDEATDAATASKIMKRDASGRAKVADPSAATDIANKQWSEGQFAAKTTSVTGSAGLSGGGDLSASRSLSLDQAYSPTWTGSHDFTSVLRVPRKADPGSPSIGEVWIATGDLKFRDNAGTPVTRKLWHDGNDGAGSTMDADLLDGQEGSYYQNASNLNTGTMADARLPTTMGGKTFSGDVTLNNMVNLAGKETGGTARTLARMNASNQVEIGESANPLRLRGSEGTPQYNAVALVLTNDSRMSDARAPTGSAGGDLAGSYPNPTLGTSGKAGYARALATSCKVIEFTWTSGGTTQGLVGRGGTLQVPTQPQIIPGRTDDAVSGYLPTGTVVEMCVRGDHYISSGSGSVSLIQSNNINEFKIAGYGRDDGSHPGKVRLAYQDRNGNNQETDLYTPANPSETVFLEVIITIDGNNATAGYRNITIVVRKNGSQVASVEGRTQTGTSLFDKIGQGGSTHNFHILSVPLGRMTLP